jgi:hypothetical protein
MRNVLKIVVRELEEKKLRTVFTRRRDDNVKVNHEKPYTSERG